MAADLRNRIARAISAGMCDGPEGWADYIDAADAVLAELGLTQPKAAIAWQEGYRAGVNDERISQANIGIAGFEAKVAPNRNNPYLTAPQASAEELLREALAGLEAYTGEATRQTQERIRASLGVGK
jgi:hypothetical protein